MNIKIGTSSYSYDDWRGTFYPESIKTGQMLEYYCQFFNTVELNVTYYTIPSVRTFERLVAKTPDDFEFIIKTNQETTHRRKENDAAIEKLLESVKPVIEAKKFYGFLAQFPYSFKNNEQNRKYLVQTRTLLKEHPLFVEFRHASWNKRQMPGFLRGHLIGYVNVDEPALKGLLPPQSLVTSDNAYIRLHGRNHKDWWDGQGSARYDYEYKPEELEGWLVNISQVLKKAFKTYIFFNNHPGGKAPKNAQQMMKIIEAKLGAFDTTN
jgi:uncharacterized protein YecE (DUF72 family)